MTNPALLKSISNITRVKILACLGESDKTVNELIANCHLSQSAVSQHLTYLKQAKLVTANRQGRKQVYSTLDAKLSNLCKQLLTWPQ